MNVFKKREELLSILQFNDEDNFIFICYPQREEDNTPIPKILLNDIFIFTPVIVKDYFEHFNEDGEKLFFESEDYEENIFSFFKNFLIECALTSNEDDLQNFEGMSPRECLSFFEERSEFFKDAILSYNEGSVLFFEKLLKVSFYLGCEMLTIFLENLLLEKMI